MYELVTLCVLISFEFMTDLRSLIDDFYDSDFA